MGLRLKNAALMYGLSGFNVLMMDYRGFGSSTGNPTENGLNMDADTVLDFAKQHPRYGSSITRSPPFVFLYSFARVLYRLKNSPIIAFGRSLGGAVAVSLAERNPTDVHAVIVENTFTSIASMVIFANRYKSKS